MWGLTLDTITAVNTVLANGTIARVTNQNHPDLFWGLRGSASSFGITTSIEVTTFPAPPSATIFLYDWDLNVTATANGIAAFQSFVLQTDIPPHFGALINIACGPTSVCPRTGVKCNTSAFYASDARRAKDDAGHMGTYLYSAAVLVGSLDTKSKLDNNDTFYAKSP